MILATRTCLVFACAACWLIGNAPCVAQFHSANLPSQFCLDCWAANESSSHRGETRAAGAGLDVVATRLSNFQEEILPGPAANQGSQPGAESGQTEQLPYYIPPNGTTSGGMANSFPQVSPPSVNLEQLSRQPQNFHSCPNCAARSPYQTCTIYVPYWETDYQTTWETRYRQEPRFEPYTVYRTLTHKEPVGIDYQVMVPRQKRVQYTQYKVFEEREPIVQNYQVYVPVKKYRNVTTYETVALRRDEIENYTVMVPVTKERVIGFYRTEPRERQITKEYFVYVDRKTTIDVPTYRYEQVPLQVTRRLDQLVPRDIVVQDRQTIREPVTRMEPQETKRVVAYTESEERTVIENVPVVEQVERQYDVYVPVTKQVPRKYYVSVPRYRRVVENYNVIVPEIQNKTGYRTVAEQVPQTYYRTLTRDCGYWKTIVESMECQTCLGSIPCSGQGCCGCVPIRQTACRRIWVPNIQTYRIPVTVCQTVLKQVPYTYQVTVNKTEQRTRSYPIMQFEQEERTVIETVTEYNRETRTALVSMASVKQVSTKKTVDVQKYREVVEPVQIPVTEFVNVERSVPIRSQELVKQENEVTVAGGVTWRLRQGTEKREIDIKVREPRTMTYTVTEYVNVFDTRKETYTVVEPQTRVRTIPKTIYKKVPKTTQVEYTVMVPETRTRTVYRTSYKRIPEVQERVYTVLEPETRTRVEYKTVTRQIPEQRLRQAVVNVPYQVPVVRAVKKCRLVPRQVQLPTNRCGCATDNSVHAQIGVPQLNQHSGIPHETAASQFSHPDHLNRPQNQRSNSDVNPLLTRAPQIMPAGNGAPTAGSGLPPDLREVRDAYTRLVNEAVVAGYRMMTDRE